MKPRLEAILVVVAVPALWVVLCAWLWIILPRGTH